MHGHQLDRRDTELLQMLDRRFRRQRFVGAAQRLGDVGMLLRETLDVHLVDDRLVPRRTRRTIVAPSERRIDDCGQCCEGRIVTHVERQIAARIADRVAEHGIVPPDPAPYRLGVWVENNLVRVEPVPCTGVVRSVHPVSVQLPWTNVRQVPVPHHVGVLGQRDAFGRRGCVG
jgi:hypothetical protein